MPEIIPTAQIVGIDTEELESDDTYPGTYGFYVKLSRDPGDEWFVEFSTVYDAAVYPGKPPVVNKADRLLVYYLPRYAPDLTRYLRFLARTIAEANAAVEKRNSVVPDEEKEKAAFLAALRTAAAQLK